MSKKKKCRRPFKGPKAAADQGVTDCYTGQHLNDLLEKIWRIIELAKISKGALPDKIWMKQQFAIGVNDVTRLLERMPQGGTGEDPHGDIERAKLVPLQAVLVAVDCNPKWLTKHIPILASSRSVPVILVKDNKGGSFKLGGLVKLKTALAIGVKARGSSINAAFEEFI